MSQSVYPFVCQTSTEIKNLLAKQGHPRCAQVLFARVVQSTLIREFKKGVRK
ncbi:hypothetical protein [uncultured Paraglaciecola sp.]|uniref:hypothetical protein n=1 Tax=uncultured Paraglaciecola sp. TaxID=1765024 RepID=UPI00260E7B22|nr:hypothetical protein [uncultured Paraglaciecola sp.]